MANSFFIELLKSGRVIAENGTFTFLNEFFILLPAKSFLKLKEKLTDTIGERKTDAFLKELGRYQVAEAIKRYSKTMGIEKLDKNKISEFGFNVMNLMGHGVFNLVSYDEKNKKVVIRSKNVAIPVEYKKIYGKSDRPIDSFICGIWEEAYTRFLNVEMLCVETKCIARGDECCQFELKPK